MYQVLFICTGNAVRSPLAEALMAHLGRGRIAAHSAGTNPAGRVHPGVTELLARREITPYGYRSKSWLEFAGAAAPRMDLIVTLCPAARAETAPVWPGLPAVVHWDINDPRAGPPEQFDVALQATCSQLEDRIGALLSVPLERLSPGRLPPELDAIA